MNERWPCSDLETAGQNLNFELKLIIQQQIMGQECCQTNAPVYKRPTAQQGGQEPLSPFQRLESDSTFNRSVAVQSRVAIRTSNLRKLQSNLSQGVKSRLQQLPSLSAKNGEEGHRVYIDRLGAYYQGELLDGQPYGNGFLQFDNGDYLEGQFQRGNCQGQGRFIKANGSLYEGDFRNGVADGYGRYTDVSGYAYEGQWKNNLPNGKGAANYLDGSTYTGEFLNNKKHGRGVLMQKGCMFEGGFRDDQLEGQASMHSDTGETYVGQWSKNEKHGEGEYCWPNGNKYKGEYKQGKRDGWGTMVYANGEYYQGYWVNGLKHGEGKYKTFKKLIKGQWRNGELVSEAQGGRRNL